MRRTMIVWLTATALLLASAPNAQAFKKRGYFRGEFSYGALRSDRLLAQLADSPPPQIFGLLEGNIELDHTFFKMLRLYTDTSLFFSSQRPDILVKLNEALIQLTPHEYVDLWVGKKRVSFSPGFSFTPSDVLNPGKNPMDPTLQREGRYGAGIQFPFDKVTVSLTWAVWESDTKYGLPSTFKFPRSTYQARVYLNLWESDFNFFYAYADKRHHGGFTFSRYLTKFMEMHLDVLFQQDRKLPMIDDIRAATASLPLPISVPSFDQKGFFAKALIGFRFEFLGDKGSANVEYYYNGAGMTRRDYVRTMDFLEQLVASRKLAQQMGIKVPSAGLTQIDQAFFGTGFEGQHHLLFSFQYRELFEVLDPQLVLIWSVEDTSFVVYPRVVWRIYAGVQLELGLVIPIGNKRSEFGQLPYHVTGIARMWVYY